MCFLKPKKQIIGRIEHIDLPEFSLFDLRAKIDTGAYRSSIHATNIKEVATPDGAVLTFSLLDDEHPAYRLETYVTSSFTKVLVKSSNGVIQERFKIQTPIRIQGKTLIADFTLTDRASMRHAVLVGRKVLKRNFLVDVTLS